MSLSLHKELSLSSQKVAASPQYTWLVNSREKISKECIYFIYSLLNIVNVMNLVYYYHLSGMMLAFPWNLMNNRQEKRKGLYTSLYEFFPFKFLHAM